MDITDATLAATLTIVVVVFTYWKLLVNCKYTMQQYITKSPAFFTTLWNNKAA